MAGTVTVAQAYNFGTLTQQSGSNAFIITCTKDPSTGVYPNQAAVVAAVQAVVPANSALISTWGYVLPLDDIKVEHITDALWTAEASYKRPQTKDKQPESNGPVIDFDTSGGTQHIIVSKSADVYVPSGADDPPDNTLTVIGDEGNGKIKGVDIGMGVYRFSEEWTLPDTGAPSTPAGGIAATSCNSAYRATLKALTFTTNRAAFRGFDIGEVLFEGATGRRVKGGMFSVSYKFAVSRNAANIVVGDITVESKGGWQYLDVKMRKSVDNGLVYAVPIEARVHTVYDDGAFADLKIGEAAL